jgi:hypothetical protein
MSLRSKSKQKLNMEYKNLINLIRSTANKVNPTGLFEHGRRVDAALNYNENFPQILLMPVRHTVNRTDANVGNRIVILFLAQDTPETSPEEREEIIQKMWELYNKFMERLHEDNPIIQITEEIATPEYRAMQATASGYATQFNLLTKLECKEAKC